MKGNLYLCGAGNVEGIRLALTLQNTQAPWREVIVLDDDPAKIGKSVLGLEILGPLSTLANADREHDAVVNLVTRKTATRWAVMEKIEAYGLPFATLVHPSVDLFGTEVHEGVTVYQGAIVGAGCTMEKGSVALVRAIVGHGSQVGAGSVIGPGAVLNARASLGKRVYVGSNAVILPDLHIGEDATVGALSSVFEDVPAEATALGVPAKLFVKDTEPRAQLDTTEIDPELVQELVEIWHEALGVEVEPTDNFFDIGGTSLLVFTVCRNIELSIGAKVSPGDIYRCLTVRALAAHLSRDTSGPRIRGDRDTDRRSRREKFFATRRKRRAR